MPRWPLLCRKATSIFPSQLKDSGTLRSCVFKTYHGFTLIEILVVIVVIAILATLVAPSVFQHLGTAKDATARSQVEMLGAALDAPIPVRRPRYPEWHRL